MSNNKFITIDKPKRGFMMMNDNDKIVMICNECISISKVPGKVKNKQDCKHAEEYI